MKSPAWVICCLLISAAPGWAANPGKAAQVDAKDLKGKIVWLRGMEAEDNLNFDAEGNPLQSYTQGSFSMSAVRIDKVHRSNTVLQIEGVRIVLIFDTQSDTPSAKDLRYISTREHVDMTVALEAAHPESLDAALPKIFTRSPHDVLADLSPDAQRAAVDSLGSTAPPKGDPSAYTPVFSKEGREPVYKPGQPGLDIQPPRLVHSVDPTFTDYARKKKISGVCTLSVIVDKTGHPIQIRIVKSLDSGLDLNAIVAVSQYRFEPAIYKGKPVAVLIGVEVNFRIY